MTIILDTQFGENTTLYESTHNGEMVWRISNNDESFYYHKHEILEMATAQGKRSILEMLI